MISLKWAQTVLKNGYDSSNRPKEGITTAKINGKVITIKPGEKKFKGKFRTWDGPNSEKELG